MRRTVHINELHDHINLAQQKLVREKADILDLIPPSRVKNREEYAFTYIRAERLGVTCIIPKLAEIEWLPLRVDPVPEMLGKKRHPLNRWIMSYAVNEPDAVDFGNDFMHVLTRAAVHHGWNSPLFIEAASRIARLFQDLTCLLNAAYFLAILADNDIEKVSIDVSESNLKLVTEMARIIDLPEIYVVSRKAKKTETEKPARARAHKKHPHLRVVKRDHDRPDPHHPTHRH